MIGNSQRLCLASAVACFGVVSTSIAHAEPLAPIWQGWYLGVDGGGYHASATSHSLITGSGGQSSATESTAGLYGGYNWQSGPWVFGFELDWAHEFAARKDSDLFSGRGRLGMAIGNVLLYGTAGVGTKNTGLIVSKWNGVVTQTLSDEEQHVGLIVGGGADIAVARNLLLRGEVLYFDGGRETYRFPFTAPLTPSTWTREFDQVIYRAGLAYKF